MKSEITTIALTPFQMDKKLLLEIKDLEQHKLCITLPLMDFRFLHSKKWFINLL